MKLSRAINLPTIKERLGPDAGPSPRCTTLAMDAIDKFFEITARGSTIWTEMRGGFATFLTMCYILAVNARLLSESGGPCECSEELRADFACRFYDPVYDECVEEFRRQL
eukprot:209703-Rhodomonas_salina.1